MADATTIAHTFTELSFPLLMLLVGLRVADVGSPGAWWRHGFTVEQALEVIAAALWTSLPVALVLHGGVPGPLQATLEAVVACATVPLATAVILKLEGRIGGDSDTT